MMWQFATQDQRVLLRKNSVITMSKVYEEVYKQLHSTDAWVNKVRQTDRQINGVHGKVLDEAGAVVVTVVSSTIVLV